MDKKWSADIQPQRRQSDNYLNSGGEWGIRALERAQQAYRLRQTHTGGTKYMTGEQFYESFMDEWNKLFDQDYKVKVSDIPEFLRDKAGEVARRAAGIDRRNN